MSSSSGAPSIPILPSTDSSPADSNMMSIVSLLNNPIFKSLSSVISNASQAGGAPPNLSEEQIQLITGIIHRQGASPSIHGDPVEPVHPPSSTTAPLPSATITAQPSQTPPQGSPGISNGDSAKKTTVPQYHPRLDSEGDDDPPAMIHTDDEDNEEKPGQRNKKKRLSRKKNKVKTSKSKKWKVGDLEELYEREGGPWNSVCPRRSQWF